MSEIIRPRTVILTGLVVLLALTFDTNVNGQTVGFQPQINSAFTGALVDVIPVASADRMYARLSVTASFSQLNGFTTYSVPIAAGGVSGFTGGLMGMNGPQGQGSGGGFGHVSIPGQMEGPLAGPFASGAEFDNGGPLAFRAGPNLGMSDWPRISSHAEEAAADAGPNPPVASSTAGKGRKARVKSATAPGTRTTNRNTPRRPGR